MSQTPELSIIVPTHNRSAMLAKSLEALSRQSWPANQFEVIVVADDCQDDTAETATAYAAQAPYSLHLLSHNARSAAATRNLGAAHAQSRALLFLDDDMIAQPDLVRAHMEAQQPHQAVLGYSKPMLPEKPSQWQYDARRWWEDTYREIGRPGHRFTYRDFFSGNFSLLAALFHEVGGFDVTFAGRLEDYELGLRLFKAGARFCYAPGAVGYHYDQTDLAKWLRRIRQEGVADILIGQRQPELRTSLFKNLEEPRRRWVRLARRLAFARPQRGDRLEKMLLNLAALFERLRLRYRWQQVVWLLREYNYWRGVAATIGGRRALASWLQEGNVPPPVAADAPLVDLAVLPPHEALQTVLQQGTSKGLRLALEGVELLTLAPQLGAEPLREEHLHYALRNVARQQFIPSLALKLIRSAGGGLVC